LKRRRVCQREVSILSQCPKAHLFGHVAPCHVGNLPDESCFGCIQYDGECPAGFEKFFSIAPFGDCVIALESTTSTICLMVQRKAHACQARPSSRSKYLTDAVATVRLLVPSSKRLNPWRYPKD
jgi:hypothetical protein